MVGKRFVITAAMVALGFASGCCSWCDKHCRSCAPAAYAPAPAAYYPAQQPAACCPPVCCPPASGYQAPQPAGSWTAPRAAGCP